MTQPAFSIITWIVALLGGGIAAAVLNWIRTERAEKKERQIKFLDYQIRKLYGPLYYFVAQSEKLFDLNKRFLNAYDKERMAKEEAMATLDISNEYMLEAEKNNLKIQEILVNSYSFIDPDDIDLCSLFYEHHIRLTLERDETGKLKTPLEIYGHIGNISFLPSEFIRGIKQKFLNKKKELDNLLKN